MDSRPTESKNSRACSISAADLVKLRLMKSTSKSLESSAMAVLSSSLKTGKSFWRFERPSGERSV